MFEKDISQLAKPEIKGRGFIGSGNEIIETQTYYTQPENDWEFDDQMLLTYNNPVYLEQCKRRGVKVDDSGFLPQKKLDEMDENTDGEDDDDDDDDDDEEGAIAIPVRKRPSPPKDAPEPMMRPPMKKDDEKPNNPPPRRRPPMEEKKEEPKADEPKEDKPKKEVSKADILKALGRTEEAKAEEAKVEAPKAETSTEISEPSTSVRDKLNQGMKDIGMDSPDKKVVFDKTAEEKPQAPKPLKINLTQNKTPAKLKLNLKKDE